MFKSWRTFPLKRKCSNFFKDAPQGLHLIQLETCSSSNLCVYEQFAALGSSEGFHRKDACFISQSCLSYKHWSLFKCQVFH